MDLEPAGAHTIAVRLGSGEIDAPFSLAPLEEGCHAPGRLIHSCGFFAVFGGMRLLELEPLGLKGICPPVPPRRALTSPRWERRGNGHVFRLL